MVDFALYINLDHRLDRKQQIEDELNTVGISYKRFDAIKHSMGCVGCSMSHLNILKYARDNKLKNILIFEDDFKFLVSKEEFLNNIKLFFDMNIEWDVLMLSYNLTESKPFNSLIQKVYSAQTTSGYMVNSCFYDKLIDTIESSIPNLINTNHHWIYAIDQAWKSLQGDNSNWYAFNTRIGYQRESYSDISGTITDYKC